MILQTLTTIGHVLIGVSNLYLNCEFHMAVFSLLNVNKVY